MRAGDSYHRHERTLFILYGFADDNTLSHAAYTLDELTSTLSKESGIALKWLNDNKMIANPSKFQAIILSKSKIPIITSIQIGSKTIVTKESVILLGIEIDFKLKFESHRREFPPEDYSKWNNG